MLKLLSGLYLGWSLGANGAATIFGTAVSSQIIRFYQAAILSAIFIFIGATVEGVNVLHTLSSLSTQTLFSAMILSLAAALTVTFFTYLKLPVSTSQSVLGAILGIGLVLDGPVAFTIQWQALQKILICWILTPLGGVFFSLMFYSVISVFFRWLRVGLLTRDLIIQSALILSGCYGAYALGANNVANVVGVFSGRVPGASDALLVALGGFAMGLGVISFGRGVMMTVGRRLVRLDAYSAVIVVLSQAVTVHIFALVKVPVSISQAIVGAVIGIGLIKGMQSIQYTVLIKIVIGWFLTPLVALILSSSLFSIFEKF